MAEFNWTVDDIKRAQRDFSNNFMRLDCIRTESYDVAIDCMTECIEKKAADVQPIVYAHKTINVGRRSYCSNCGKLAIMEDFCSKCGATVKDGEPTRNLTDEETEIYESWIDHEAKDTGVNTMDGDTNGY